MAWSKFCHAADSVEAARLVGGVCHQIVLFWCQLYGSVWPSLVYGSS
ncbi:hypothetical protein [Nocardia sp. XZ_19_369]|nr:hypothetical protein [Nocardia sp. XZ_19_369]